MLSFRQFLLEHEFVPFSTVRDIYRPRKWIKNKVDKIEKATNLNLEPSEKHHTTRYTSSNYYEYNDHLRKLAQGTPSQEPDGIKHLKSAIAKHRLPKDVWLHHGTKVALETGMKHTPEFLSTSVDPHMMFLNAPNFAGKYRYARDTKTDKIYRFGNNENIPDHLETLEPRNALHIHAPKGARGLYVEPITNGVTENEVILHPGTKIKYNPKPTVSVQKWRAAPPSLILHHYGKLVHDGVEPTRHWKPEYEKE